MNVPTASGGGHAVCLKKRTHSLRRALLSRRATGILWVVGSSGRVLGEANVITRNPNWGWSVEYDMPQQRVMSRSGVVLAHNLSKQRLRIVKMTFLSLSSGQLDEHIDMLENCSWGEDSLVIVPDTNRNWAIHGKPSASINTTVQAAQTEYWRHEVEVIEDPGPIIVK